VTVDLRWTDWAPLEHAYRLAPTVAGVYEVRDAERVVYVGQAGHPRKGVSARLRAYAVGKSPDSGLAGHASTRALADPQFCARITEAALAGNPWTVSRIPIEAYSYLGLLARSAAAADPWAAELQLIDQHDRAFLWNVR